MKRGLLLAALPALAASSCHEAARDAAMTKSAEEPSASSAPPSAPSGSARADADVPPRCVLTKDDGSLGSPFGEHAELGESAAVGGELAFGALRPGESGRVASVIVTGSGEAHTVDLGPLPLGAPAPQPFVRGSELFAVAYVKHRASAGAAGARRALSVFHVAEGALEHLVDLAGETDESSAFDVVAAPAGSPAGALVAWDDVAGTPPRGFVQVAALSPDLRSVRSSRTLRPAADDAGSGPIDAGEPRLAARPGGYWMTWIARRPEGHGARLPVPAGEIETPSEEATYGWVEMAALDADGAIVGTARRLTSMLGHVGSVALHAQEDGSVVVVAEDDGASARVGGGSLVEVKVSSPDAPFEVVHLVRTGVEEETPPSIVAGGVKQGELWLSFVDVRGDVELLPLGGGGPGRVAGPVASREPLLSGARLVGPAPASAAHPEGGAMTVVSTDSDSARGRWSLHRVTCDR